MTAKSALACLMAIAAIALSGCLNGGGEIKRQTNIRLTHEDIRTSSPITPSPTNQSDFSLPFYEQAERKCGYKCASALPDGRTGYISKCELRSKDGADDIAEWYKRRKMHIKYIDMPECRKIIVSDNKGMTVYPSGGRKAGSTLVIFRNEKDACTELVDTGFRLSSGNNEENTTKGSE